MSQSNLNSRPAVVGFRHLRSKQSGAASILVTLLLLLSITAASFAVARVSLVEQRISTNDYRTREARAVAQAGLEYGTGWISENTPVWATAGGVQTSAPSSPMPSITAGNGDSYSANVQYSRSTADPTYVLVTSVAKAASDADISARAQVYVRLLSLVNDPGLNTPPIMLDGCVSNVTGNPDIYPEGYDGSVPAGDAIATSKPATVNGSACIDNGSLDLNGGTVEHEAFSGDLWNKLFAVSRAEMRAVADAEVAAGVPDSDRSVIWVDSTSNYHKSWGSASKPVILVFSAAANCPKINGGPTIYGILFMDSDCLGASGFGGLDVFGTVAVNGDISKLTANTDFSHFGLGGAGSGVTIGVIGAGELLGSWKDF